MVAATVYLNSDGNYSITIGGQVGIAVGVSAIWGIKNLMRVDHQGWFNNLSGIY